MASFLYFVPRAQGIVPNRALLEPLGLWGALGGRSVEAVPSDGPENLRGLLLLDPGEAVERRRFDASGQVWTPEVAAAPRYHVGAWRDALPGPDDLGRASPPIGWSVTMGDGRSWLVPAARIFPEGTQLPATLILGPDGLSREIRPEYAALSALAERLWGIFETGGPVPFRDLADGAIQALAVNYRLGAAEVNLLRLFEESVLINVAKAMVDMPTVTAVAEEVAARKKAGAGADPAIPATHSSCDGARDSSPATGLPAQTSTG